MNVCANAAIDMLVQSYRDALEENGELIANELVKGYPEYFKAATYQHDDDSIEFVPNDAFDLISDDFKLYVQESTTQEKGE